ncbi:MAG: type II toxin-antitoxin system VapC family toxin [Treponema sp.]|nr:type II toxin-antitoxin system VapC family toxin [Treponema sp.]
MNRYLLDTHSAIWFFNGDNSLSETAKKIIFNTSNIKYVSIVSAWEIAIKVSLGKLEFSGKVAGFIYDIERNGFILAPIKPTHLSTLENLPMIHRDPFDRLLIATAIAENMTLITVDENIVKYEVSQIW